MTVNLASHYIYSETSYKEPSKKRDDLDLYEGQLIPISPKAYMQYISTFEKRTAPCKGQNAVLYSEVPLIH